jgi:hypothetical protein
VNKTPKLSTPVCSIITEVFCLEEVELREITPLTIMLATEDSTFIGKDCVRIVNKFNWWDDLLE